MTRPDIEPAIPIDADGEPVFDAPWQAQAFAMVLALHERGVFAWPEWAELLGKEIASKRHGKGNEGYYSAWLSALETMIREKGLADQNEMSLRLEAWDEAAKNTPHGQPIKLGS
ncbi:MAG: nitrile hydratase accessory protein [Rhizobiaceae bacterium]